MTIPNYVQYRCNANLRYGRMQGKRSRVSDEARYTNILLKSKLKWYSILKESAGFSKNENQYWLGNA